MGKTQFWCVLSFGFFLGSMFAVGCGGGGAPAIAQAVANAIDVAFDNSVNGMASSEVQSAIEELNAKIAALETKTAPITLSRTDLIISNVNVHIQNGEGGTDATNSRGNLIIGYNEDNSKTRTGSHNLVIGPLHSYSSYGGLVACWNNETYSSVGGGDSQDTSSIVQFLP